MMQKKGHGVRGRKSGTPSSLREDSIYIYISKHQDGLPYCKRY